jgi:Tfp pilus assembly protein PilF
LSDADALFKQALSRGNNSRWQSALQGNRYWVLLEQARQASDDGNPQSARELLQRAIAMNPREIQGHISLADLQAAQGQLEAAETTYRQALKLDAANPNALRGLATVLAQSGKLAESQRLIDGLSDAQRQRLGDLRTLKAAIAIGKAKDAERSGDLSGARSALEEAVRNDPGNVWARYDLAQIHVKAGAPDQARQVMAELLRRNPGQAEALYASALFASRLNEWPVAQAHMEQIPVAQRTSAMQALAEEINLQMLAQQAQELTRQGQRQQAIRQLQRAESLAGDSPTALSALASAYIDIGQTERALTLLRSAIAKSQAPTAGLRIAYASALLKAGKDEEVSTLLRELRGEPLQGAEQRQYDDLVFQYTVRQADLLREKGDLVAAYDTLAPALAQRPDNAQAVSSLARMYLANRNPQKAVELLPHCCASNRTTPTYRWARPRHSWPTAMPARLKMRWRRQCNWHRRTRRSSPAPLAIIAAEANWPRPNSCMPRHWPCRRQKRRSCSTPSARQSPPTHSLVNLASASSRA